MSFKKNSKKAFTLIELIIVLALSVALIVALGGGMISLQNSIKLDNAIRDLKIELQSTQNTARNSFVTYNQSSSSGSSTDLFNEGNISLGWLVTVDNVGTTQVRVTRQSIFFNPPASYDFNRLRDEVVNFRQLINQKRFRCDGGFFAASTASTSGAVRLSGGGAYQSITTGNPALDIFCSTSLSAEGEFFENDFNGVVLATNFGANPLPTCWSTIENQKSIFFTSGYGEPVVPYSSSAGLSDCQLQLQNSATIGAELRALRVSYQSGVIDLCGAFCVR